MLENNIRYAPVDTTFAIASKSNHMDWEPQPKTPEIGIKSETDRLKKVGLWGAVGVEAALAQLYPPKVSLFASSMDVIKARSESNTFSELLSSRGVEVLDIRHEYAMGLDLDEERQVWLVDPKKPFFDKADEIMKKTGIESPGIKDMISTLLDQDIKRYGLERAYVLNKKLSLDPQIPMGNLIYGRDSSNTILGRRVKASMAYKIREPEAEIYESVYEKLGLGEPIKIPKGEKFEGGDAYIHDGVVYVGVGPRTTMGAALHIYKELRDQLQEAGFEFAIVEEQPDPSGRIKSQKEKMDFMHLDTWSMPVKKGHMVLYTPEAKNRRVTWFTKEGQKVDEGQDFLSFLNDRNQEIITITEAEQQAFSPNVLVISEGVILSPVEQDSPLANELKAYGIEVITVDLDTILQGYGGGHCMTAQLLRGN